MECNFKTGGDIGLVRLNKLHSNFFDFLTGMGMNAPINLANLERGFSRHGIADIKSDNNTATTEETYSNSNVEVSLFVALSFIASTHSGNTGIQLTLRHLYIYKRMSQRIADINQTH